MAKRLRRERPDREQTVYDVDFKDTKPVFIKVTDEIILHVDPAYEQTRARRMLPVLLRFGQVWRGGLFNENYPRLDKTARCYDNAMHVVRTRKLIYTEGLMLLRLSGGKKFPLPHGWCMTPDGEIVDPTCYSYQHIPEVEYFGVQIKTSYAKAWKRRHGYNGLLDGHHLGEPVGVYHDPVESWRY